MHQATNNQNGSVTIDELMAFLKEHMLMKEDAERFATKEDIAAIRREMATKEDIAAIRREMATKEDLGKLRSDIIDFVDRKITDLKGDIIAVIRKEDAKLLSLVRVLLTRNVITTDDVKTIISQEPFPRPAL